ncbi:hypothetical protein RRG08_044047 [Elysia crispata]|uniref:Uncharacterized protein n=1 Tax=Elysia crispata TaxID=231223 RepID=A0AAE1CR51_9GAST|nr:hypothetical protein RRG08_044047 [Elysia crispata]
MMVTITLRIKVTSMSSTSTLITITDIDKHDRLNDINIDSDDSYSNDINFDIDDNRWQRRLFRLYDDGELTYCVDENVSKAL